MYNNYMIKSDFTDVVPLPGYVLLAPIQEEKKNGFIATVETGEKQLAGIVVGIGDSIVNEFGTELIAHVNIGDKVIHRSYGHESYKYNGIEYRFVKFMDLVGRIEK